VLVVANLLIEGPRAVDILEDLTEGTLSADASFERRASRLWGPSEEYAGKSNWSTRQIDSDGMKLLKGVLSAADDLIVDPRSLVWLREAGYPVVADITHSLQQPGGRKVRTVSAELVECMARVS
jgi:hypothetical protein